MNHDEGIPSHRVRFEHLDALLVATANLWRPAPFRVDRPAWCDEHPALAEWLLHLDEPAVERLALAPEALAARLSDSLPVLADLATAVRLPRLVRGTLPSAAWRLARDVPGRKQRQIEAFADAVGAPAAAVLEWCAGKGHLGRLLAAGGAEVVSIEREHVLAQEGRSLAVRAGVLGQQFVVADVRSTAVDRVALGRHVMALHACGGLHRTLVRGAGGMGLAAVDLSPCCYHLDAPAGYAPGGGRGALRLARDELRIAVTESVTASPRLRSRSRRGRAFKLGFLALREAVAGVAEQVPLRPVPEAWLAGGFEAFCRRLAAREGIALPDRLAWQAYEASGERRRARVDRLSLVRGAFRRGIELWLASDYAIVMEEQGFEVRLGEFCEPSLTPRNLLLSARRAGAPVRLPMAA